MPACPSSPGRTSTSTSSNRHRIPPGRAAGLAWSVNPQIHAFDDLSLMENLQAQPATIATARSFAPAAALFVTPITLRPRFNAVAVTDQEFPEAHSLKAHCPGRSTSASRRCSAPPGRSAASPRSAAPARTA